MTDRGQPDPTTDRGDGEPVIDLTRTAAWQRGIAAAKATAAAAELERTRLAALPKHAVANPRWAPERLPVDVTLDPDKHWTDWAQAIRDAMGRP